MASSNINWNDLFSSNNIEPIVEAFYNIVNTTLEKRVPIYIVSKYNFPRWFDSNIQKWIKEKYLAHKQYKINPNPSTYLYFPELRAKCNYFSKQCHERYLHNI